jgi:hypothetical protein
MTTEESNSNLESALQDVETAFAKLNFAMNENEKAKRILAIETGTALGAISESTMKAIEGMVVESINMFADFGSTFTPTDRTRLISTGIKNFGFIETAYNSAETNPQLIPSYLNLSKYKDAITDFRRKQSISLVVQQLSQNVLDGMLAASDIAYHDALEYYDYIREAARRRVPGAETEYNLLKKYFKKNKHTPDPESNEKEK